jgi:hypothetical protein
MTVITVTIISFTPVKVIQNKLECKELFNGHITQPCAVSYLYCFYSRIVVILFTEYNKKNCLAHECATNPLKVTPIISLSLPGYLPKLDLYILHKNENVSNGHKI